MSLAIDVDLITRVLLSDGWHDVADASFSIDAYEYLWSGQDGVTVDETHATGRDPLVLHGGGHGGITSSGYTFRDAETGDMLYGPLSAVIAVAVHRSA